MSQNVVITGGAGFLGSHLADRLLADGCSVTCVDNLSTGTARNLAHIEDASRFSLILGDVAERLAVPGPVSAVLHLASPASPAAYLRLPVETLLAGSAGTVNALKLARAKGARFLLASTSEVYGNPLVHPQHEGYWGNVNPVGPRSVYDEAKRFAEAATAACSAAWGVETRIARIFNTYGPRMRPGDGRAIPVFIQQALAGEPLTVTGDGQQTRSVCYVDDLADGIVRLLWSSYAGPVNLGNPAEMTILELAGIIRDMTGSGSQVAFTRRPQDDPMIRCPDISLARDLLGWEPSVSLRDGLERTIAWFRAWRGVLPASATP